MSSDQVIGIDLGGTAIKLARFTAAGELLAEMEVPTPQPAVPGAVTIALCEAIEQLDPRGSADRVGVGLPGPMDAAARVARVCINLPGWEEVPLAPFSENPRSCCLRSPVTIIFVPLPIRVNSIFI